MSRLLITLTILAVLLPGCAGQSNSARPDDDGGFVTVAEGSEQGLGSERPDADESGEQAQEVDAEGTESPLGERAAQPLPEPLTGTLGREDIEGGCVYLGANEQRFELIAGPDVTIRVDSDSGEISDGDGNVVAQPGDTITVDGSIDAGMASFCQIGPILVVESITAG